MFTSSKEEYKSAYRDRRIFARPSVQFKGYFYSNPPSVKAYQAAIQTYSVKDQGESVGYHIGRYKLGKISKQEAIRFIRVQYQYNLPKLP